MGNIIFSLYGQTFRLERPVKDNIQTNGSYLYGEPALWNPEYAHRGIDMGISYDTVYSASDGIINFIGYDPNNPAGYEPDGCGNYIFVKSEWEGKNLYLLYCHLTRPLVSYNQQVSKRQPLAISGNTGYSTGPHLHFELRLNNPSASASRNRRNPELWVAMEGMGAIYGRVPNAGNNTRVDVFPDPKPRPPYTTFGYALTYNFNDPAIGSDDLYQENYTIGDVKPGTYTITALNGNYTRTVTVNAGEVVNADISTSVEAETSLAGKNFELFQNYPNPFNARTNIDFKISAESSLLLIAYNSLGEKIAQLAEGVYYPGSYSVSFDAEGLASGIYFYRISVTNTVSGDSFSDIKKLILLK